ncbi:MAG: diguanylate cyclase [Bacillus sp. (in: Bacteria)]|nr:diguanylate cyclase [Bacillus sp. (in: firmicutes)]MCM1427400.1 diguanylate cyclase [Eubacterium sp.]
MGIRKTILIVDDDRMNLVTAQKFLAQEYKVVGVNSGKLAFKYLEKHRPDLILLDIFMPVIGGFEVMAKLQEHKEWRRIPVIFLTADRKTETEARCFEMGAYDFITKPFEPRVMLNRIHRTIELDGYRKDLQLQLDEKTREVELVTIQAITTVANTIDAKDDYTKGHSMRVAYYSEALARKIGWSEEDVQNIHYIALLHDIGKIGVPDSVLNKPFKLTNVEFELIKNHTTMGAEILKDIKMFPNVSVGAKFHHERYDGRGYPNGLRGEEIPEVARVIGIVDSYDAMTSNRVYRKRLQDEMVKQELVKGRGTQFDPYLVDQFMELLEEGSLQHNIPEEDMVMPIFNSNKIYGGVTKEETGLDSKLDYLTGLLGREQGEKEITESLRNGSGCFMLIDLDNFRQVNETYGHLAGDYVLKWIADLLKDLSEQDIVCRMGGDEFLYYVEGISGQKDAADKAERILNIFEERKKEVSLLENITFSIGISLFGIDGGDFDELLRKADKALYHAKQSNSKDCYLFYQSTNMAKTLEQSKADLHRLVDMVEHRQSYQGAFQIDYEEFGRVYDFVLHFSQRNKQEVQLILFTLFSADGSDIRLDQMEQAMQCMEQAIIKSLRGVDVGTRYSSSQFLVVLLGAEKSDIRVITDRIVQNYFKLYGKRDITLSYDIANLHGTEKNV